MPETKFNAYVVSLLFGDRLLVDASIAQSPEHAAVGLADAMRRAHPELPPLSGCAVQPLFHEFMKRALRSIETGIPPDRAAQLTVLHGGKEDTPEAVAEPPAPRPHQLAALAGCQNELAVGEPVWRTDGTCVVHGRTYCLECDEKSILRSATFERMVPRRAARPGMNIAPVCFVDVFDLAASLPRRLPLFRRQDDALKVLHLRGPRKDTTEDAGDFIWYGDPKHPERNKWPELRNMVEHIKTLASQLAPPPKPEFEIGRVYFEQLSPGKTLPWSDPMVGAYADRLVRVHLPLRAGPSASLFAGIESYRPSGGELVVLNHRAPTSAANFCLWPRIHLIIDLLRTEHEPASGSGDDPAQ